MRTFPIGVGEPSDLLVQTLVIDLVWDASVPGRASVGLGEAQAAVAIWLMDRAGFGERFGEGPLGDLVAAADSPLAFGNNIPESSVARSPDRQAAIDVAAARFAALDAAAQQAWLAANWQALRAGSLTLDDLP
jgi:hypothetical protein